MSAKATSPRGGPTFVYTKLHDGLDHALMLLLKGEDAPPAEWKIGSSGRQKPFEAWRAIHEIAADRRQALREKEARRHAKRKFKKNDSQEDEEPKSEGKPEPKQVFVVKPIKTKDEVKKEKSKEKEKMKKTESKAPVVKTLDLSGANLSPVMTYSKAPASRTNHDRLVAVDAIKPLPKLDEPPVSDLLARLRKIPHLDNLESGSNKYNAIVKWLETDDGSNLALSPSLSSMINKLQRNGTIASSLGNGKSSPKRALALDNETLDDRLKRERKLNRKNGVKSEKKNGVKTERRRRKTSGGSSLKRRIQNVDGFVVGSDEEEYDDSAWAHDSEEEYESEEASESDGGVDFEIAVEGVEDASTESTATKEHTPTRTLTPPVSGKTSPRSPTNGKVQQPLSATEQLAIVTAKLRESEKTDTAQAAPTYLSYDKPQSAESSVAIKEEPNVPVLKVKLLTSDAGSSESNAIVLDDSDEEDEEDDPVDVVLHPRVLPAPASPKPSPRKQSPAARCPKPSPRKHTPPPQPKTPPPATKPATKAAGKAKAASVAKKRKVEESEEEESEDEVEFVAPGDEDSSTDAEEDMFDLNEDDVYVVESILDVKRGRTLVTNFGRPTKEADLFLVKWEGYDELTWEPDANIPKRIVQFFNEREQFKKNCGYQIDKFLQRKVAKNSTTGREEILYLIQWKGMPQAYWEVKATLPPKTHLWLEKTSRATLGKTGLAGPSPRKKAKA